jgi:hypothetical protein
MDLQDYFAFLPHDTFNLFEDPSFSFEMPEASFLDLENPAAQTCPPGHHAADLNFEFFDSVLSETHQNVADLPSSPAIYGLGSGIRPQA